MDLVLNRTNGSRPGQRHTADFCCPASWCTAAAAAANKWKMEENASFVHQFLICRARLTAEPACAHWQMCLLLFDGPSDWFFLVLFSISGEKEDRCIQQIKQMDVGISIDVLFSCVLKGRRKKTEMPAFACFRTTNNTILSRFIVFEDWINVGFRPVTSYPCFHTLEGVGGRLSGWCRWNLLASRQPWPQLCPSPGCRHGSGDKKVATPFSLCELEEGKEDEKRSFCKGKHWKACAINCSSN